MNHTPDNQLPEPPNLRRLRRLVTILMITLILGFILITATLVIRLTAAAPPFTLPRDITLPEGETASAVTFGDGWMAVVTTDSAGMQRLRLLDRKTREPIAEVPVTPSR